MSGFPTITARHLGSVPLTLLLLLAACGGDGTMQGGTAATAAGDAKVTIYSGRSENLVGPLLERFKRDTGNAVEVRYGDSADLALLVDQEGDRSPADVFFSQSPGATGFLAGKGRLAPLPEPLLDLVDERFRNGAGLWIGVSGRIRVLVYNTTAVDPAALPESVFDLTGPEFRGRVGLAPTNGSFQDFVTGVRSVAGDDVALAWLRGMRDNDAVTFANNTAIVEAVARGDVPLGLVNHYYLHRLKAEDPGLGAENFVFPNGDLGAMNLVSTVSILTSSARTSAAEDLVRYLLAEDAQRYFSEETFEYPLTAGVTPAVDLPPLDQIQVPRIEFDSLGGGLERTKELIDESGLETS